MGNPNVRSTKEGFFMTKTDWWETFTKTGCVTDYLYYKGIGKEEYSCVQPKNRNVGERTLESVSNSDRDDTVRVTYR